MSKCLPLFINNQYIVTMKKIKFISFALILSFLSAGFVSCSDKDSNSDQDTVFEEPEFESDAAKYEITDLGSPYKSIELTASGNYIIITSDATYASLSEKDGADNSKRVSTILSKSGTTGSRAYYSTIIEGKYVRNGINTYLLEDFGTITVVEGSNGAITLKIKPTAENEGLFNAIRKSTYPNSTMTNNLCRTWVLEKLGARITDEKGRVLFDRTYDKSQFNNIVVDGELQFDDEFAYPEKVIFSKSGTYMVLYCNHKLAISTWKWMNESQGILRYSWNYDNFYDEEDTGEGTVTFIGSHQMIYSAVRYDDDDDEDEEDDGEDSGTIVPGRIKYETKYYFSEIGK